MELELRTDDVHRQVLQLLPPDLFDLSDLPTGIGRIEQLLAATPAELPATVSREDHEAAAGDGHRVLVRLYRPAHAPRPAPALFWIHGGGMVMGDVAMDDASCADLADRLQIVVASVEYRVAPAWPYPTPLDDCQTGLRWLVDQASPLGIDPERLALGGGSAGGGLAAGLALRLRDAGGWLPCFQLLRYPMLDDRNITPSSHAVTDARVWNRAANQTGWGAYLGERVGSDAVPPAAAPARAVDLAGLPPTIVTVGGLDLFVDEDVAYAAALLRAGVPVELHVYPAAFHGSDQMVPHAELSQRWRQDEEAALRRALDLRSPAG